ncbi:hypothetical protein Acr_06g0003030 [Actinidia rufa]|uniref:Uncharacterized protein n=1 Tax=Actinidia rufa TaxID=165716 RepID=A0A7J0EPJ6_9ERIC|nr:hypothetical protein Acr_06g0003030 [Actinidia rufa]
MRNRLIPRPSASSPLDYRAHSMANISQASDLEGLYREMHDIAEQIRIVNENNALLQHLFWIFNDLAALTDQATILRAIEVPAKHEEAEILKDYVKQFNQVILEVDDPNDKVSKVDKYIAIEELVEAKRRRRGRDDKRKEPDTKQTDYRDEARNKRPDQDSRRRTNDKHPRTPPRRLELILPPLTLRLLVCSQRLSMKCSSSGLEKSKLIPEKGIRTSIVISTDITDTILKDCFQLKEQIGDLIKKGYLRKYVANRLPPGLPERRYGNNRLTTGDI